MPNLGMANQTLRLLVKNQKQASPQRCGMNLSSRKKVIDNNQEKEEVSDHRDAMGHFVNPVLRPTNDPGFADDQSREKDESLVCLWHVSIAQREVNQAHESQKGSDRVVVENPRPVEARRKAVMRHGRGDGQRTDDRHAAEKEKSSKSQTAMPGSSSRGNERRLSQQKQQPCEEERRVNVDEQAGKWKILCSKSHIFGAESVKHGSADQHRDREEEQLLRANAGVCKRPLGCDDRAQFMLLSSVSKIGIVIGAVANGDRASKPYTSMLRGEFTHDWQSEKFLLIGLIHQEDPDSKPGDNENQYQGQGNQNEDSCRRRCQHSR